MSKEIQIDGIPLQEGLLKQIKIECTDLGVKEGWSNGEFLKEIVTRYSDAVHGLAQKEREKISETIYTYINEIDSLKQRIENTQISEGNLVLLKNGKLVKARFESGIIGYSDGINFKHFKKGDLKLNSDQVDALRLYTKQSIQLSLMRAADNAGVRRGIVNNNVLGYEVNKDSIIHERNIVFYES